MHARRGGQQGATAQALAEWPAAGTAVCTRVYYPIALVILPETEHNVARFLFQFAEMKAHFRPKRLKECAVVLYCITHFGSIV